MEAGEGVIPSSGERGQCRPYEVALKLSVNTKTREPTHRSTARTFWLKFTFIVNNLPRCNTARNYYHCSHVSLHANTWQHRTEKGGS